MSREEDFLILDAIERHRPTSQKSLARRCNISVGKVNYVLKRLMEKGLVKVANFRGSRNKSRYIYLLTPSGLEAKARLTVSFIRAKVAEFEEFRRRLLENLLILESRGVKRLLVLSSDNLGDFLVHIARTEELEMRIVCAGRRAGTQEAFNPGSYDCILVADEPERYCELLQAARIPADKITRLR